MHGVGAGGDEGQEHGEENGVGKVVEGHGGN
jgi:hypothetical protein